MSYPSAPVGKIVSTKPDGQIRTVESRCCRFLLLVRSDTGALSSVRQEGATEWSARTGRPEGGPIPTRQPGTYWKPGTWARCGAVPREL